MGVRSGRRLVTVHIPVKGRPAIAFPVNRRHSHYPMSAPTERRSPEAQADQMVRDILKPRRDGRARHPWRCSHRFGR